MTNLDVIQVRRILADADQAAAPERWTGAYVGQRLVDAFAVLDRLPISCYPAGFRSPIAQVVRDEDDAKAARELLDPKQFNWSRSIPKPRDISRMEQTFDWLRRYLIDEQEASRCLQCWAISKARHLSLSRMQRHLRTIQGPAFHRKRLHAAVIVASGLIRDRVTVT